MQKRRHDTSLGTILNLEAAANTEESAGQGARTSGRRAPVRAKAIGVASTQLDSGTMRHPKWRQQHAFGSPCRSEEAAFEGADAVTRRLPTAEVRPLRSEILGQSSRILPTYSLRSGADPPKLASSVEPTTVAEEQVQCLRRVHIMYAVAPYYEFLLDSDPIS